MDITELKISHAYLFEDNGMLWDGKVVAKTKDGKYVKIYDPTERRARWYTQKNLADTKIIDKVTYGEVKPLNFAPIHLRWKV